MTFWDALDRHRQPDGLVSPDAYPTPDSTGNGLLYTALAFILKVRRGEARPEDAWAWRQIVGPCFKAQGLLNRSPTKTEEQEGPDDYIAVAYASRVLNTAEGAAIVMHGKKHRFFCFQWIYNNLEPGKFTGQAWFGRQPHVPAHFWYCVGIRPNLFRRIAWALAILVSIARIRDSTSAILSWMMIEAMNGASGSGTLAGAIWEWRFRAAWPGGMKQALGEHLGHKHPIATYWV